MNDDLRCESITVRTAAFLRDQGGLLPAGYHFQLSFVTVGGPTTDVAVGSLLRVRSLVQQFAPATVTVDGAAGEDTDAMLAIVMGTAAVH